MAANVDKSPLIRFVDELDFKQIPVAVKRKKKEECSSGLILIDSNCELKKVESSSESSSGEEDELEGENNSDQDQTSSSCSESGEISKSGEAREKGKPRATTSVKRKSSKRRKASKNILSKEEVEELCERLESKRHDLDCEIARKLESSPNLAFYPSRAALKEAILGDKNVLNEITDEFVDEFIGVIHDVYHTKMTATDKGCIVDKLVKFMGICYHLRFMALSIFKFEPVKLTLKSPSKINSMLSGNADNEVSRS